MLDVNSSLPSLDLPEEGLPQLATNCIFLGHAQKADVIWTREEFLDICEHMLNGNAPNDFLLVYRDKENRAKFAKAKNSMAGRRATWSWDTITGKAKSKVGIGFYPSNQHSETRWGAMDFDAHDGNALRARGLALAAFDLLHRQPQLYVILGTSGSEGWHLFVFAREFYPIGEWTRLLKQVAVTIGATIEKGICELFPDELKSGMLPCPIRAPGTYNPKTDALGMIAHSFPIAQLCRDREEKEGSAFLYHSPLSVNGAEWNDRSEKPLYRGPNEKWAQDFAIKKSATRAQKLKKLVLHIFHQVGRETALRNAQMQYAEKTASTEAAAEDHEREFHKIWRWKLNQWLHELSTIERAKYDKLLTELQQDVFRITRSFSKQAKAKDKEDFPFPVEEVGHRVGRRFQSIAKMRVRFESLGIIKLTVPCKANIAAARYRWIAQLETIEPF